jgi:hypothetical protein
MSQLTLDSAILEVLLKRAVSAARLVGYIEDGLDSGITVGPLADEIDAIVHELSELLGNPHLRVVSAPNARSTFASGVVMRRDVVMRDDVPELGTPDIPAVSGKHTFSLGIPSPCAALATECEASRASHTRTFSLRAAAYTGRELEALAKRLRGA